MNLRRRLAFWICPELVPEIQEGRWAKYMAAACEFRLHTMQEESRTRDENLSGVNDERTL